MLCILRISDLKNNFNLKKLFPVLQPESAYNINKYIKHVF